MVNEINTIPGSLARYLWVSPPLPFATLLLTCSPRPASGRPTPTPPPAPTERSSVRPGRSPASWAEAFGRPSAQLLPGEKVLVDIRPHWSFLTGPLARRRRGAIAVGVTLDVAFPHTSVALHWVEGIVVAVPCLWLARRVVRWRTTRLILTSLPVGGAAGGFLRPASARPIWRTCISVVVVQSLVRRMIGSGRLELEIVGEAAVRWIERRAQAGDLPTGGQPSPPALWRAGTRRRPALTPSWVHPAHIAAGVRAETVPSEAPTRQAGMVEAPGSTAPGLAERHHASPEPGPGHPGPEDAGPGRPAVHQCVELGGGHIEIDGQAPVALAHQPPGPDQVLGSAAPRRTRAPAGTRR